MTVDMTKSGWYGVCGCGKIVSELRYVKETQEPKMRWKKGEKSSFIKKSILESLKTGPKTFEELYGLFNRERMGITDQSLSDVLRDLLLYDKSIKTSLSEVRIYEIS